MLKLHKSYFIRIVEYKLHCINMHLEKRLEYYSKNVTDRSGVYVII